MHLGPGLVGRQRSRRQDRAWDPALGIGGPGRPDRGAALRRHGLGQFGVQPFDVGVARVVGQPDVLPLRTPASHLPLQIPAGLTEVPESDGVGVDLVRRCGSCEVCASGSPFCAQMQLYGYTQGLEVRSGLHGGYGEYMEIMPTTTPSRTATK